MIIFENYHLTTIIVVTNSGKEASVDAKIVKAWGVTEYIYSFKAIPS